MSIKRICAFIIDFIIVTVIYEIPFFILVMIPLLKGQKGAVEFIMTIVFLCEFFAYLLLVFKDSFKFGSLGKKILKLKIVERGTNQPASLGKSILRKVTCILSWVEFIVYAAAGKRIGDMLAKTDVVEIPE